MLGSKSIAQSTSKHCDGELGLTLTLTKRVKTVFIENAWLRWTYHQPALVNVLCAGDQPDLPDRRCE